MVDDMPPTSIRSILAAIDLNTPPERDEVLRAAAALADRFGAEFHVLHTYEFPSVPYWSQEEAASTFPDRIEAAERALDEHIDRSLAPGVTPTSREVIIYTAHRAILDRAAQVAADLIVLGPHRGRGGIATTILGTTADRVIRTAGIPCLVVRAPLELPVRRIGVPTDFSEPARDALTLALVWADALAAPTGPDQSAVAEVAIVHAAWTGFGAANPRIEEDILRPMLDKEISAARERVVDSDRLEIRSIVVWGEAPGECIVDYASEEGLQLLVMGTHGQGGLRRALIGSVASSVARTAPCSVLLVPPGTAAGG